MESYTLEELFLECQKPDNSAIAAATAVIEHRKKHVSIIPDLVDVILTALDPSVHCFLYLCSVMVRCCMSYFFFDVCFEKVYHVKVH